MNTVDIVFFVFLFLAMIVAITIKPRPFSEEETKALEKIYERIAVHRFWRLVITYVIIIVAGIYYMIVNF
jgi:hypothetical protein